MNNIFNFFNFNFNSGKKTKSKIKKLHSQHTLLRLLTSITLTTIGYFMFQSNDNQMIEALIEHSVKKDDTSILKGSHNKNIRYKNKKNVKINNNNNKNIRGCSR